MGESAAPRVAVLGAGQIGDGVVRRLVGQGHRVTVVDPDPAVRHRMVGQGIDVAWPALTAEVDAAVACLPHEAAWQASVADSEKGILAVLPRGGFLVETSTVAPRHVTAAAALCAERGVHYLDCPVSTVTGAADSGEMTLMLGSDDTAYDAARPVLDALSSRLMRVGPVGAGTRVKLFSQYLGLVNLAAAYEALHALAGDGVSPRVMVECALQTFGSSRGLSTLLAVLDDPALLEQDNPRGLLSIMEKDFGYFLDAAGEAVGELQGVGFHRYYADGLEAGYADRHYANVGRMIARRLGAAEPADPASAGAPHIEGTSR